MSVITKIDQTLAGQPDRVLTAILFILAAIAVFVALNAKPTIKAAVATWFIAP